MNERAQGWITNCHVHVFTTRHVPNRFVPMGLAPLLRFAPVRRALTSALGAAVPFTNRDRLSRAARFIEYTYKASQAEVWSRLISFYPPSTRFVVLPMDMEFMGAGPVDDPLETQLDELVKIRKGTDAEGNPAADRLLPLVPVDPRRPGVLDLVKRYIEEHDFVGLKLYPPLGYWPNDERLMPVYEYASRNGIPILTHTARGGVSFKGKLSQRMRTNPTTGRVHPKAKNKAFTDLLTNPDNFRPVLEAFPNLRINFAHYGSTIDWTNYLADPWQDTPSNDRQKTSAASRDSPLADPDENWIHKIHRLMSAFPGVYTDVSYTLVEDRILPLLKVFLHNNLRRSRVLFGTDFYMLEQDGSERETAIRFRYAIGEECFGALAIDNPARWLGR